MTPPLDNQLVDFFTALFALAERRSVSNISELPGPWVVDDLGDGWTIAINGTKAPVEYNGVQMSPLVTYVHHAGMPIAVLSINSGVFTGSIAPLLKLMEAAK